MATYPPPSNRGSPVYNPIDYNIPNTGGNAGAGSGAATLAGNNVFTGSNSFVGITSTGNNSISGYASLNGSNTYTINADNLFQTGSSSGNLPITLQQDTTLASTKIGQDKTSNNFDIVNSVAGSGIYFSDSSHNFTLTVNSLGQPVFSNGIAGEASLSGDNTFSGVNTFTKQIIPELGINVLTTDKTATYTEIYSNADAISGGTAIFTQGKISVNNAITLNPTGAVVTATSFVGSLTGNATSATNATNATKAVNANNATNSTYAVNLSGGTTNQVPYQLSTGITKFTTGGTQGQVLTYNTSAPPSWTTVSTGGKTAFTGQMTMCIISSLSALPTGWLPCNGASVSSLDYPNLFAIIGNTYGTSPGQNLFYLPNFQGAFPIGWNNFGTSSYPTPHYPDNTTYKGGTSTLTSVPYHTHTAHALSNVIVEDPGHFHLNLTGQGYNWYTGYVDVPYAGASQTYNGRAVCLNANIPNYTEQVVAGSTTGLDSNNVSCNTSVSIDYAGTQGAQNILNPYVAVVYAIYAL